MADNSDQEVNQDVALVQALQANFVTFTDEVEAAQRAARVPKQPAMRRPAGGELVVRLGTFTGTQQVTKTTLQFFRGEAN